MRDGEAPRIIVQFDDTEYCIDRLAERLEYFAMLRSSAFGESATGRRIDLTHRGRAVKLVLDVFGGDLSPRDLPSADLAEMRPILDEFLADPWWAEHMWHVLLDKRREEEAAACEAASQEKEGLVCGWCGQINKWLRPANYSELDWEDQRDYCTCDYERDDRGSRLTRRELLEQYYSSEVNCKHGSSTW